MRHHLHIEESQVADMCLDLYKEYGTTMAGLKIFFDDSTRNIASGKAAGFHTVIVGRPTLVPGADHALESIHNMKEALPEIWDSQDQY
ncbi:Haloacid dehalogenase-like hydrolase (HAD) superfamily protein [Zea mays]|uniref:Haloacid dehalogenase-like hydrolase (HAD) superfamily protein n=1 Tax=Zea mays TaxID=4577 RepID=A0A1D6PG38_MAIZE|nr:Haloacid dehalogenase-like hydrolase (HAD) superfamily protein [Zea mays]